MQLRVFNTWLVLHNMQVVFLMVINAKNIKGPPIIKLHPKSIIARRNYPLTLNCAVSGAQEIHWFRDGERVVSTRQNVNSHRIVLPDGSLFFLRITNNKRDGDAGVYWCVASNRKGKTKSHNATLSVAFLEDFQLGEQTVTAMMDATAVLKCGSPRGLPKPRVRWKQRNSVVQYNTRMYPNLDGDLIIDGVTLADEGVYYCEASNLAGSHKSSVITLDVKDTHPQPVLNPRIANIHEDVILPCNFYGKPSTTITWKKKNGKIPINRSQIVKKYDLQISNLAFSDTGEYFCESVGDIVTNMAVVSLKVYEKPEIIYRSPDQLVSIGESFNVSCNSTGNPKPLVVWKVPSDEGTVNYLLSGQNNNGVYYTNYSRVMVNSAERSNSGSYTCWSINLISAASTTSTVTILKTFPPPLMGTRPLDLDRKEGSTATFPCEASSESFPAIISWWHRKDDKQLDIRIQPSLLISILPIGALVIKNVSITDGGIYTCEITSNSGSVKAEAILTIDNLSIGSHPTRYVPRPAPPSKPVATSMTDSSISISWMPNSKRSTNEHVTYVIEMWTSPWPKWETVVTGVLEESSYITGLSRNQPYLFVVKAFNKYGSESFPSPWSNVISTSDGEIVDLNEQKLIQRRLSKIHVSLVTAKEISSGTVDLLWKVNGEIENKIKTFAVYYVERTSINRFVVFGTSSTYRLTDMRSKSNLTIFVAPILGSQEGTPSNLIEVETGYGNDFQLTPYNINAVAFASGYKITWQDPSRIEGRIIGYKVLILSNGTTTYYSTNETLLNFSPRSYSFSVKVAIVSENSQGPWSEPKIFRAHTCCHDSETMPSVLYSPFHPAWFLYLLIPTVIFIIVLSLVYLRYIRKKSAPVCTSHLSSPVYYSDSTQFKPHNNVFYDKKSMTSVSEPSSVQLLKTGPMVAEYAEPRCRYDDPEPYATTALLSSHSNYVTSFYDQSPYVAVKKPPVNWSNLLPPPPHEPPPVEMSNWNSTEQFENCVHCCHQDSHVYEHPCNAISSVQSHYIAPHLSQFTRFTSLQVPKREECFKMEAKSSTH